MHGFFIEKRTPPAGVSLSRDLAQHIFVRSAKDNIVVVTTRPQDIASITKKQWHILIRQVQRERSSTLNSARITELDNQVAWMQHLVFIVKPTKEQPESIVSFITPDEAAQNPPRCSTLYLIQKVSEEQFGLMTRGLTKSNIVVMYIS